MLQVHTETLHRHSLHYKAVSLRAGMSAGSSMLDHMVVLLSPTPPNIIHTQIIEADTK